MRKLISNILFTYLCIMCPSTNFNWLPITYKDTGFEEKLEWSERKQTVGQGSKCTSGRKLTRRGESVLPFSKASISVDWCSDFFLVSWHLRLKADRHTRLLLTRDTAHQSHRELRPSLRPILREKFSEQVMQQHFTLFLISTVGRITYVPFPPMDPF